MSSNVSNTTSDSNGVTPQNFYYVAPLGDPNSDISTTAQIQQEILAYGLAGVNQDSSPGSSSSSSSTSTTSSGVEQDYVLNQQSYNPNVNGKSSSSDNTSSTSSTTTVVNADGTTTTTTITTTGTDTSQTTTTSGSSLSSFARAQNSATGII